MTNLRTDRSEELRYCEFRAADDPDGRTLEGYAAVFNAWTNIRDAAGTYKEQIAPGAFKRSLGTLTPKLQFDHGQHPLIGSIPIGQFTVLREDRNGLFVRARLSDNWMVQPVRDAISDGGITGMSFRFRVIKDDWGTDGDGETRTIQEVELMELGPVVFPAYQQTSVAVRALANAIDAETRAEMIQGLIDANTAEEAESGESRRELSTSTAAVEPAEDDDSPDEPPVASRNNTHTIHTLLAEAGVSFLKGTSHVHQ
jgi:HK97 family phage prohead protease